HGEKCDIGNVKIGFVGQKEEVSTYSLIDKKFSQLPEMFFSLGESIDYYVNLSKLSDGFKHNRRAYNRRSLGLLIYTLD
ncbi:hypothetical protein ACFC9S_14325, partial [Enterococcus faecalis]